ncbi:4Fe-4S binding protein [Candidatus Fermentibacterales bacterium]|nr:4Fe-4S binding protein [Candidatus Fermentibacterales bacterium]
MSSRPLLVSVGSGKGGTGKTTVATSLALALSSSLAPDERPLYLDCDVEEPDSALFLKPEIATEREVGVLVPIVDEGSCTKCGTCSERCAWNAIAVTGAGVMVFPELCHGCGSCVTGCPSAAISEELFPLGILELGTAGGMGYGAGRMNVGSPMPVPVIRELKCSMLGSVPGPGRTIAVLDSPPGSACPFVETVRGSDLLLLVTEPTPFGLHDLRIAVEVARDQMGLRTLVVVNRDSPGYEELDRYCRQQGLPIALRIPFSREIAECTLSGCPIYNCIPLCRELLDELRDRVLEELCAR